MDIIEEFLRRYRKEVDFYGRSAQLAAASLERSLQSAGIRAIVTWRPKTLSRLETKVRGRAPRKNYQSLEDIYSDIVDLAGVRIALYFPGEEAQVDEVIQRDFDLICEPKTFPEDHASEKVSLLKKRFSGYAATHYRVRLREPVLSDTDKRYADAPIEVQVASVLMHAWSEVEHDLIYKPLEGALSDDEYAILDELNGLVLAGEVALGRLQKAGERRVGQAQRTFANHYELALYLLGESLAGDNGRLRDSDLGHVDVLFEFLRRCGLNTPNALQQYLQALDTDFEQRPVADQIIDRVLAEDEARYAIYEEVRRLNDAYTPLETPAASLSSSSRDQAAGEFINVWMRLETLVRNTAISSGQPATLLPSSKVLRANDLLNDDQMLNDVDRFRRMRNNLVHGPERPPTQDLRDAAARLREILGHIEDQPSPGPR